MQLSLYTDRLTRIISINKPCTRVHYDLDEIGNPNLVDILEDFIQEHKLVKQTLGAL